MKPINSQLFYYVMLAYAVGMVAYIALPIKPSIVIADRVAPPAAVTPVHGTAGFVAVKAHAVSLDDERQTAPLLSEPASDSISAPRDAKDAQQSL